MKIIQINKFININELHNLLILSNYFKLNNKSTQGEFELKNCRSLISIHFIGYKKLYQPIFKYLLIKIIFPVIRFYDNEKIIFF